MASERGSSAVASPDVGDPAALGLTAVDRLAAGADADGFVDVPAEADPLVPAIEPTRRAVELAAEAALRAAAVPAATAEAAALPVEDPAFLAPCPPRARRRSLADAAA